MLTVEREIEQGEQGLVRVAPALDTREHRLPHIVTRIGLEAYAAGNVNARNLALSAGIGLAFWTFVFGKLVVKHANRISSYGEGRHFFLKFFDIPAFIIMAIMMTVGMAIRYLDLAPETCIAVFYTGLGVALALAGARFGMIWATAR